MSELDDIEYHTERGSDARKLVEWIQNFHNNTGQPVDLVIVGEHGKTFLQQFTGFPTDGEDYIADFFGIPLWVDDRFDGMVLVGGTGKPLSTLSDK